MILACPRAGGRVSAVDGGAGNGRRIDYFESCIL
jgi:hypothetical protein